MNIHILRGQNQIGGNMIEIATDHTKILLDAGLELTDSDGQPLPKIQGLFDYAGYDAIIISHYHGDHIGLVYHAHKEIPVYLGEASYNIILAADRYRRIETFTPKGFLHHRQTITIGDISVIPYLCDHSAFDSYMLFCEADGETVLYTGDFRSNGRKSFSALLHALPKTVDTLLCEGTTLSRENYVAVSEQELEKRAADLFCTTTGPVFVLQASMNIDRIVTMYRAAKQSNRIFLEELYMAEIATAAGKNIPNPNFDDVYAFITSPSRHAELMKHNHIAGKSFIASRPFVMCVRNSMFRYLKSLSQKISFENGLLIYSFWSGYRETDSMKSFLSECEKMGLRIVTLHTSGHADANTLKKLIDTVNPKSLFPIHTENAEKFKEIAPNVVIKK